MSASEKPELPKADVEKARALAADGLTSTAQVYAMLALADAIKRAGLSLGGALVEAARIRAGLRGSR